MWYYTFDDYSFTFKGNGLTISNLNIKRLNDGNGIDIGTNVGLFGKLQNCSIDGLNFSKASVEGHNSVGVLVGSTNNVQISNCTITDSTVFANSESKEYFGNFAGLFVGYDTTNDSSKKSSVKNCYILGTCEVKSGLNRAGFVGYVTDFTNCYEFTNNEVKDYTDGNGNNVTTSLTITGDTKYPKYNTVAIRSYGNFIKNCSVDGSNKDNGKITFKN